MVRRTPDGNGPTHTVMWFRRDLRLGDNPALLDACASDGVLPLFVVDPRLWDVAGRPRRAYLSASLRAHDASLRRRRSRLAVLHGDPVREVLRAAREVGASRVHVAADFGPYGRERDARVEDALAQHGVELVRTGSPYAVAPGRVTNGSSSPYKVFTPFARAWAEHGWRGPVDAPSDVSWLQLAGSDDLPDEAAPDGVELPEAGERAALRRWRTWVEEDLAGYHGDRDRPDLDVTSRMSVHLKWGEIHPRTMLADLASHPGDGATTYRKELAWREFYADVLHARPETARDYLRPEHARMRYDEPGAAFDAWREGRTGFPLVDAGMRQLASTGWMHNRVRMVVASFLVKDLHVEWQNGARHFMRHLVDADLASNQHGWQWVAGCGTDAAPYFRVFNPEGQGRRLDPDGTYVKRWVPELRAVDARHVHNPAAATGGMPDGYPEPVVDHAEERREALARYDEIKEVSPMDAAPSAPDLDLVVPHRFRGPARSGNGGWTAGSLAERVHGATGRPAVEVTLRRPPPLDTAMAVRHLAQRDQRDQPGATITIGGDVVAEAVAVDRDLRPVEWVDPAVAEAAMRHYPGLSSHPFPGCFACGPDRADGDGLRIFPGPVPGRHDTVASLWVPHPSLAEQGDVLDVVEHVGVATTWAALDCVGGWSEDLEGRPSVLGRMTARVDALPVVGDVHVVVGEKRGIDGRKTHTASTLYDSDERVVATAEHVWVAVDPSAFS